MASIRRECLDHVVILGARHLRRTLTRYFSYYHQARTHLSLDKDTPDGRVVSEYSAEPVPGTGTGMWHGRIGL